MGTTPSSNPGDEPLSDDSRPDEPIDQDAGGAPEDFGLVEAYLAEVSGGSVTTAGGPEAFAKQLDSWWDENPDMILPSCEQMRKLILEEGEKQGIYEADRLPANSRYM